MSELVKHAELVALKDKDVYCDSRIVAEKFEMKHTKVTRTIQRVITDFDEIKGDSGSPLIFKKKQSEYRGQAFDFYEMNKKAFSMLVMRLKTKKARIWQGRFFDAFMEMEKALVRQQNIEWKNARKQGKQVRREYTDIVKGFVDYAETQGSKNAKRYYSNLTKMEYKALRLIEKNEFVPNKFRNMLDGMQLSQLMLAEKIAETVINNGMINKFHYKEIYLLAKQAVEKFAESVINCWRSRKNN